MQLRNDKERKENNLFKRNLFLKLFQKNIKNNNNFSFTKYGDGELKCIFDFIEGEKNCDKHPYSKELGESLKESLVNNSKRNNVFIGDWTGWNNDSYSLFRDVFLHERSIMPNFVYYEMLLNHDEINEELINLYKDIKESKRRKIFIGSNKLESVINLLNVDKAIYTPSENSYSEYEKIEEQALEEAKDGCVFILSFGMPSKILIDSCLSRNEKISMLDFGSSFDALFLDKTREGQVNKNDLKEACKNLLT